MKACTHPHFAFFHRTLFDSRYPTVACNALPSLFADRFDLGNDPKQQKGWRIGGGLPLREMRSYPPQDPPSALRVPLSKTNYAVSDLASSVGAVVGLCCMFCHPGFGCAGNQLRKPFPSYTPKSTPETPSATWMGLVTTCGDASKRRPKADSGGPLSPECRVRVD